MEFFWQRRKRERAEREYREWYAAQLRRTPASDQYQAIIASVIKNHPPVVARLTVESTAASQWSTVDFAQQKKSRLAKALKRPVTIKRDHQGRIRGIYFNPQEIREQVEHWRWLYHHPKLTYLLVKQAYQRGERIADSALFL